MMSQKETTQKTMNEERWNTVIAPVEAWVAGFTPTNEDEEDRLELVEMQLRRGNRSPAKRTDILKQFRLEFAVEIKEGTNGFEVWQRKTISKEEVAKMVKKAVKQTTARKAFWDKCDVKPTFSKKVGDERQTFTHPTFEHWNDMEVARDVAAFKKAFNNGEDWGVEAPVFEIKSEESA